MGKTRCPKCGKLFDNNIDRYVMGTLSNTLKFGINFTCRLTASTLGGCLGSTAGRIAGKAGGAFADSIGCGFKDMNGWNHQCPRCKHEW